MRNNMNFAKTAVKVAAITLALAAGTSASAQTAGSWLVKLGYNKITPQISSGDLSAPAFPNTKTDIESASAPIFTITYMYTDNLSVELGLGAPYKHDLVGDGAIKGIGKIGTVEQLPPTIFAQYRFLEAKSAFRPYVGVGLTYAMFQKETGSAALTATTNAGGPPTTFKVDSAFGITPHLGASYAFNDKWFADAMVSKTFIKTKTTLSTGQTQDIRLDPVSVSFSVGYRF
jgi:outer membrane protein